MDTDSRLVNPAAPPPEPVAAVFRVGIRQKAALILVVTLLVSLTLSGWHALQSQKRDILREIDHRGRDLAGFVAHSLVNSVVAYDYHAIELVLQELTAHEDIVYAKVLSPKGNVMAETPVARVDREHVALFERDIQLDRQAVGRLTLGLSKERMSHTLENQGFLLVTRTLLAIVLIVLIGLVATHYVIIRPITHISRAMGEMRDTGDDGDAIQVSAGTLTRQDEIGELARTFGRMRTGIARAMQNLRQSEQRNRALIEAIPDMIFRLSRDGVCIDCKVPRDLAARVSLPCIPGEPICDRMPREVAHTIRLNLDQTLRSGKPRVFYYRHEVADGVLNFEVRVSPNGEDEVLMIVRDLTDQRNLEARIDFLAHYDSLTHLPNRMLFKERLGAVLERARRDARSVAVLVIDLDRFKFINDTLGHDIGDLLLQGVGERLQRCLRTSDYIARQPKGAEGVTISRPGGDEFTILLTQLTDSGGVAQVARRIIETLAAPFRLNENEVSIGASVGIALYPHDGSDVDTLIKNADTAMHHAKEDGRNSYKFFAEGMNAAFSRRLAIENRLRKALERSELLLHYQPQVELANGRVVGLEALLRWKSAELGSVSPAEFIPLAEDTWQIIPIGAWVLRTACAQNKAWQEAGFAPWRVAVNLSGMQFRQPGLTDTVREILHQTGLAPEYLELELTEGIILRNDDEVIRTLKELKDLGVHLSIDDFGTGYSSLSYLKRFPLDTLKIDRSFVRDITTDADDAAITSAIIAMAHSLKVQVIAEGVETCEQLAFLHGKGCDLMQGYLFSPPVPAETIPDVAATSPRCALA